MTLKPINVYKTLVGWSELKADDNKHESSHKLLTNEEWEQVTDYVDTLKAKIKNRDQQIKIKDEEINNQRLYYDAEIAEMNKKSTEDIARIRDEVDRQKGLNENLLRITRERSNARRGLQPKKKHSGYKFIGKISQIKVVREHTKQNGYIYDTAWTATLETPYDATIPLDQIKDRINSDLLGEYGICGRMRINIFTVTDSSGKKCIWTGEYKDVIKALKDERSFLYDIKYASNPKSKLWEVQMFTTGVIYASPELV